MIGRCGTRSRDHHRGQNLAGGTGMSKGQGVGLSPRAVDYPAARRSCPATRTGRRASKPRQAGPGDGLRDLGGARGQAAQAALLPEQRDPEFEPKMAEILCVYRQVAMLRAEGENTQRQDSAGGDLAIVSYDEKPGIQAIGTTAPDRPPR